MAFRLITGRAGKPHVSAADMGWLYALTKGDGRYRLDDIGCEIVDANTVKVSGGNLLIDGRHFMNSSEGENLAIANGSQGVSRIDLIVARYEYIPAGEDYTEEGTLRVIQGTSVSGTPEAPEHAGGSILNGDHVVEVPLFEVTIEGIAITSISECLLGAYELPAKYGGTGVAIEIINRVQGAIDTALAAAAAATQAALKASATMSEAATIESIEQLAVQVAAFTGQYVVVGETVFIPQTKAAFSGEDVTFYSATANENGEITLS